MFHFLVKPVTVTANSVVLFLITELTVTRLTFAVSSMSSSPPFVPYTTHHMMTSSNGNIFHVTGHLCGEFTGPRWIPHKKPVTRSFGVFFDLRRNNRLNKQSWGWWFETLLCPLWRQCNDWEVFYDVFARVGPILYATQNYGKSKHATRTSISFTLQYLILISHLKWFCT